jgi:hypothetical protein
MSFMLPTRSAVWETVQAEHDAIAIDANRRTISATGNI